MASRVPVLGVGIDPCTRAQVLEDVHHWLRSAHGARSIATVNAEFLVAAQTDHAFRERLAAADRALADGVGVVWAAHFLALPIARPFVRTKARWAFLGSMLRTLFRPSSILTVLPEKLPGSDLAIDLCRTAAQVGAPVYLLGGGPGVAARAADALRHHVPNLRVAGTSDGSAKAEADPGERMKLNATDAKLVLLAFSATDQLAWMERNLPHCPGVRVAMGVGGTLDFLAGARDPQHRFGLPARQPPTWMRRHGLDWLWRLVTQPYRWKRVFTAVWTFSMLVLRTKIRAALAAS